MSNQPLEQELELQQDLDGAVEQFINIGEKDPSVIASKVISLYGMFWVREQLAKRAEELIRALAVRKLGAARRQAMVKVSPGQPMTSADMQLKGAWVPGPDGKLAWKKFANFTADDHDARAEWYEKIAAGNLRAARWHREIAQMLRDDKCKKTGDLKRDLPVFSDDDES